MTPPFPVCVWHLRCHPDSEEIPEGGALPSPSLWVSCWCSSLSLLRAKGLGILSSCFQWFCWENTSVALVLVAQVQLCCSPFNFTPNFPITFCLIFNLCFRLCLLLDLPKSCICCICKAIIKHLFAAANTGKGKNTSANNVRFLLLRAGCLSSKILSAHELYCLVMT